ncbi:MULTISPECIES: aspartate carbamoyltransferase [unclassified Actinobaculum]|uniref:aspartate/ornithine carbamoyltransferase family protein n=1 Tax=unclassified Actinobaculum TaxID=2609299 RepID=UPI000D5283D9|nr:MULTISPECIES: aspartate carbamoyltransferase [unclassified Actinobaculum]AWE43292.1 aspartate carbamoyltransferase [Actinobaculum sp. 313]RTE49815.1 aspartate carbamoyltransferase [Actinobaculum sp. 352]
MSEYMRSMKEMIEAVDNVGKSFISINDLSPEQLLKLFELGKSLELFNRSKIDLFDDKMLALMFFQPSTRTRMSFQTAMERMGGHVIVEANPKVTSSVAKEESIEDTMRCISQYANVAVIRHYDEDEARRGAEAAECPVINGGWGHWEHPTQALLDLYTIWRRFGHFDGLKVAVVSPNMIEARTGHSMAYGLARLGADVTICSDSDLRTPNEVTDRIRTEFNVDLKEEFDFDQDGFNNFVRTQDYIYLPGCSAPAGAEAEAFKKLMDRYLIRYDTLRDEAEKGHMVYVTHTLPRRAGEMDLAIDNTPHQLYFRAILQSVSIRMALLASILGL